MSGGGYRAMLFHLGALWRLNEAGMLQSLERVASVSGGSITAGVLALAWPDLGFSSGVASRFEETVAAPIHALASRTVDLLAAAEGLLIHGSVAKRVARSYDRHLYHQATLQDLPDNGSGQGPRFVFNATNLQTGARWRFSRREMGDYKVGLVSNPTLPLATAVAASSAFPPFLSPLVLKLGDETFRRARLKLDPAFRDRVVLSDGGVYDNLGVQNVWGKFETVLVSDGGGKLTPRARPGVGWGRMMLRVLGVIDQQVRNRRLIEIVGDLESGERAGAYWGIRTNIEDYEVERLDCPHEQTLRLAMTKTRLKRLDERHQRRLVNWGYAVSDAGLRRRIDRDLPLGAFPYPHEGVGARSTT